VVGIFVGGGTWAFVHFGNEATWSPGLIGLLVLIAAIVLIFTGRYPQTIYDFVLGMNRWVLRVAAYAGLLTDKYPPFRLDMGGPDPGSTMTLPAPGSPPDDAAAASAVATAAAAATTATAVDEPPAETSPPPPPPPGTAERRRGGPPGASCPSSSARYSCLISLGLLVGGGVATSADQTQRKGSYVTSSTHTFATGSYAITSQRIDLGNETNNAPNDFLGRVRIRATAVTPNTPVFIGIAPQSAVDAYLAGASRRVVTNWWYAESKLRTLTGPAPTIAPTQASFWAVSASGTGRQTVTGSRRAATGPSS